MADINEINAIGEEVAVAFTELTQEERNRYIQQWTSEILRWIYRANAYIQSTQSAKESLSKRNYQSFSEFAEMLKWRKVANKNLQGETILRDGYILLNKIGETIRGDEIIYSITVAPNGEDISTATGGVFTWQGKIEEFLNFVNISAYRIRLREGQKFYKDIIKAGAKEWTDEQLQDYKTFADVANRVRPGYNINEGQLLEAFLRHIKEKRPIQQSEGNDFWHLVHRTILETIKAPASFLQGGDINNQQIKGLEASVTNLNSLVYQFQQVLSILAGSSVNKETIQSYVKSRFLTNFESKVSATEDEVVDKLIKMFTSSRDISIS